MSTLTARRSGVGYAANFQRVSGDRVCRTCGKPDWCTYATDDLWICMRISSDQPARNGGSIFRSGATPRNRTEEPEIHWGMRCEQWAKSLSKARREVLEDTLGLPRGASGCIPAVGFAVDHGGPHYTFPARDGSGHICGLSRRYGDGSKKSLGHNGLFIPSTLPAVPATATLYIVEGASDTMAMTAAGLPAMGRPSNSGGSAELGEWLVGWRGTIVVLAENDEKEDGLRPGLSGAVIVADRLRAILNPPGCVAKRRVVVRTVPDGVKDPRVWFNTNGYCQGTRFAKLVGE